MNRSLKPTRSSLHLYFDALARVPPNDLASKLNFVRRRLEQMASSSPSSYCQLLSCFIVKYRSPAALPLSELVPQQKHSPTLAAQLKVFKGSNLTGSQGILKSTKFKSKQERQESEALLAATVLIRRIDWQDEQQLMPLAQAVSDLQFPAQSTNELQGRLALKHFKVDSYCKLAEISGSRGKPDDHLACLRQARILCQQFDYRKHALISRSIAQLARGRGMAELASQAEWTAVWATELRNGSHRDRLRRDYLGYVEGLRALGEVRAGARLQQLRQLVEQESELARRAVELERLGEECAADR